MRVVPPASFTDIMNRLDDTIGFLFLIVTRCAAVPDQADHLKSGGC